MVSKPLKYKISNGMLIKTLNGKIKMAFNIGIPFYIIQYTGFFRKIYKNQLVNSETGIINSNGRYESCT